MSFPPDTRIYDGLGEKRENELQQRAEQQTEYQLREETLVFLEIAPKKLHSVIRGDEYPLSFVRRIVPSAREAGQYLSPLLQF